MKNLDQIYEIAKVCSSKWQRSKWQRSALLTVFLHQKQNFKICSDQGSKDFLDVHFAEHLSSKSLHCLGRDKELDSRDFLWNFPFLLLPLRMNSYLGSSLPSRSRSWPLRSIYKFCRLSLGSVLKPPLVSSWEVYLLP